MADGKRRKTNTSAPLRSAQNDSGSVWQTKKRGKVGVISPLENCGYGAADRESLKRAGWGMYRDGKKVW